MTRLMDKVKDVSVLDELNRLQSEIPEGHSALIKLARNAKQHCSGHLTLALTQASRSISGSKISFMQYEELSRKPDLKLIFLDYFLKLKKMYIVPCDFFILSCNNPRSMLLK